MRIRNAIVRLPAANFASGITTASLGTPSFEKACEQHAAYRTALSVAGATVTVLEPDPRHPDAHFVEDVAVVLDAECAVLTRPGASARAGEVASIRRPLERFFETLDAIEPPGTLDGGDVCDAGDRAYIGLSQRTNAVGATQLANLFARAGKDSAVIDVRDVPGILHLKSGMSYVGDGRFVAIDALAARIGAPPNRIVRTAPGEEYGANCVLAGNAIFIPAGHPRLYEALARAGYAVVALDVSEFRKMDGGLSCLSLRF